MPARVNGSSVIDQASLARRPFGKRDCGGKPFRPGRPYLGQTTAEILQTLS